jgi:flagellar biosynthetic protein FlhB
MAEDQDEKTEEATQTRREEFRAQGDVAQTKELASAVILLVIAGAVMSLGRYFFSELYELFQYSFGSNMVIASRTGDMFTGLRMAGEKAVVLVLPVFGITLLIGVASSVVQTGFLQVEDGLTADLNRINPLEGFKRLFTLKNFVEALKAVMKCAFIGYIAYRLMEKEAYQIGNLMQFSPVELMAYLGRVIVKLCFGIGVAMGVLAGLDYFFQRWNLEKKMMMTKQEVKEENKSREGDPLIKSRIRKMQRDVANRKMLDKVKKADVVITNPTHIAVVLKYDENLPAPQLVARGADFMAEKIKEIARENNIPIVENIPLARTIYKTMKLGQVIPRELFIAVAEVLSYVYKLRRKAKW